jgi:hypothetical protein
MLFSRVASGGAAVAPDGARPQRASRRRARRRGGRGGGASGDESDGGRSSDGSWSSASSSGSGGSASARGARRGGAVELQQFVAAFAPGGGAGGARGGDADGWRARCRVAACADVDKGIELVCDERAEDDARLPASYYPDKLYVLKPAALAKVKADKKDVES